MKKGELGDFLAIRLNDGRFAFGRILKNPLVAFYDFVSAEIPPVSEVAAEPVAFKIWVMNSALKSRSWTVIGNSDLEPELLSSVPFAKQDSITKALVVYQDGKESPATFDECKHLEYAAVWSAEHIEDRLMDHFHKRKNKWVESLRIKK